MAELQDWAIRSSDNNVPIPNGWPEHMDYRAVNNTGREVMAVGAREYRDRAGGLVSTGTSSALVVTPNRAVPTLQSGMRFTFRFHVSPDESATLNVGGTGAIALADNLGNAIEEDSIPEGFIGEVVYHVLGSQWRLLGYSNPRDSQAAAWALSTNTAVIPLNKIRFDRVSGIDAQNKVVSLLDIRSGVQLGVWRGTRAQYTAVTKISNVIYIVLPNA